MAVDILGHNVETLDRVHSIATYLVEVARFRNRAEIEHRSGYTAAAVRATNAADTLEIALGEAPSIARLRAAVVLLAGITDETIREVTTRDLDHLSDALRRVDDGEL